MSRVAARVAAANGWIANIVGRVAAWVVWFAPRRTPWALVIAALLALGAWSSIEAARAIVAGQPRPEPVGLAEMVGRPAGWVGTSTIVHGPFLDSTSYGAPVQRWYYLLIDPRDGRNAMVVRSPERLEQRRTRTITARVTIDPGAVASVVGALDRGDLRVDGDRYLVELPDRPRLLIGEGVARPSTVDAPQDREIVLRGGFAAARRAPDGGDAWEYLVQDDGRALVVRSPYPPDALPVDVWGVAATDPLRVGQALAVSELQAALGERLAPEGLLLEEGVTPPLPEVSYLPAMVLGLLAALLTIGWVIGYPIFRRRATPRRVRTWRLVAGEEVAAYLYGVDRRGAERVALDGAPARFELLRADERERRAWQFALRQAAGRAPGPQAAAASEPPRLVLSSGQGPILVALDPPPAGLRLAAGDLVHAGSSRPALRMRADGLDLVAAFASDAERGRALVAIDPARLGELRTDAPSPSRAGADAPQPDELALPLRASAVILAAAGALLVAGGAIGIPGALSDPGGLALSVAQVAIGILVMAVGRGVLLRRDWAHGLGFNIGWVGAATAAFLVVAAPQCGLWLLPNLAACEAAGLFRSAAALAMAIGLGYVALAVRRHAGAFNR